MRGSSVSEKSQESRRSTHEEETGEMEAHASSKGRAEERESKRFLGISSQVYKNVILLSVFLALYFSGHSCISSLQSSINLKHRMGYIGLVSKNLSMMIAALFLPSVVIKYVTLKWSIVLGLSFNIPYVLVQRWPILFMFVLCNILAGIGTGIYFAAIYEYLHIMSEVYCNKNDVRSKRAIVYGQFYSIFVVLFVVATIIGSGLSLTVLRFDVKYYDSITDIKYESICGIKYCSNAKVENPKLKRPSLRTMLVICIITIILFMTSLFGIILFITPEFKYQMYYPEKVYRSNWDISMSGIKLLNNTNQQLLILYTFSSSVVGGYLAQGYSEAYVACAWGIHNVGSSKVVETLTASICGLITGFLIKYVRRVYIVSMAYVAYITIIVLYFIWKPSPDKVYMFIIISLITGFGHGCIIQTFCLPAILFPEKVPEVTSNSLISSALGFTAIFCSSLILCNLGRVILIAICCILSFCAYELLEWKNIR